ncbi:MAG: M48 family metallopeptidase, partial [Candidatus Magasanikbacteria bacterium]|jgi:predicted metal-dependent hydrolase|nr:M48 family metallopeptidase [Candidatus Magasanikbacteria bacterium]
MGEYTFRRSKRAKRLRIEIDARGGVLVVAPERMSQRIIDTFIKEKKSWIQKHVRGMQQKEPTKLSDHSPAQYQKYKERARALTHKKLKHWNEFYGFEYNQVRIKNMKTRWGSCSSEKNLNFHYKLLFLSEEQQDYLIVHELCHLRYMSHGPRFWGLVERTIPNYKRIRKSFSGLI